MEGHLWWAVAGMALIVCELVTGTFYLLVIGIAALAGAAVAFLQHPLWAQAGVAAAVATAGVVLVTRYRANAAAAPNVPLDVGQSVVLDSWVSEAGRHARVRYRNALWDATVLDGQAVQAGHTLYIRSIDGSTLNVSTSRPA